MSYTSGLGAYAHAYPVRSQGWLGVGAAESGLCKAVEPSVAIAVLAVPIATIAMVAPKHGWGWGLAAGVGAWLATSVVGYGLGQQCGIN